MTTLTADWLTNASVQAVCQALEQRGHQALFVGGCVRNGLLGRAVDDIDLATDAVPEATISALESYGLKAVPTGVDHGTVTAVSDGQAIEITTFRRDVATDGRRAVVAFSDRIEEDAARRDFTMNALYAKRDGSVLDPIHGLPDLREGRLRFIGDPDQRIAEDYLRILRFFRFQAWYANPQLGVDPDGLAACASGAEGLARISAERIWSELAKLLAAIDPATAVNAMARAGVLGVVVPGADPVAIAPLVHLEQEVGLTPDPIRRLASLGQAAQSEELRMSRAQGKQLDALRETVAGGAPLAECAYRHGAERASDIAVLRAAMAGQPLHPDFRSEIEKGASAVFPVTAADLMPDFQGAALGARLAELQAAWIASGFSLSKNALLHSP